MEYFNYSEDELGYLIKRDEILGDYIVKTGYIKRTMIKNPYQSLINSFISQQISTKAANTIWARLLNKVEDISPENIDTLEEEEIKSLGMSYRKAGYIKEFTKKILSKEFNLSQVESMTDEDLIDYLSSLKGVGIWTAEMFMIFSLGRKNILSYNDLAIRRGIMKLYNLEDLNKEKFSEFKELFSPYSSIASLYIWEAAKD